MYKKSTPLTILRPWKVLWNPSWYEHNKRKLLQTHQRYWNCELTLPTLIFDALKNRALHHSKPFQCINFSEAPAKRVAFSSVLSTFTAHGLGIMFGSAKKSINGSLSFDDTFSVRVNASWKHCFLWTFILFFEWLIYIHHCPPVNNEGWHAEFHPLGENLLLFFEPLPKNKETVGHQNTVKSLATCEHYWII